MPENVNSIQFFDFRYLDDDYPSSSLEQRVADVATRDKSLSSDDNSDESCYSDAGYGRGVEVNATDYLFPETVRPLVAGDDSDDEVLFPQRTACSMF